jgi:TonB family protein
MVSTPTPSFSEGGAHGLVTVEANVDASGRVTATRVVANTTGDEALASTAEREIRGVRFVAPIRNCVARAFIFTYKRAF